ncbi:hypothetical protein IFM89_011247 [Coptis chinensis]|uniref:Myb/SANT-like domain-containing protein n=1 Tax=Coptis chinensis TaxID=261450 RepID=A0A835HLQ3_9MAGN|nr:hypothetical protein IFM89_011247 [Coptis chinensis]
MASGGVNPMSGNSRVTWNANMEPILIEVLLEEATSGRRNSYIAINGWTTASLKRIANEINRRLNMTLVSDNVRSKLKIMKKDGTLDQAGL